MSGLACPQAERAGPAEPYALERREAPTLRNQHRLAVPPAMHGAERDRDTSPAAEPRIGRDGGIHGTAPPRGKFSQHGNAERRADLRIAGRDNPPADRAA